MSRPDAIARCICWLCVEIAGGPDTDTTEAARTCYKKFGDSCGIHIDGIARARIKRLINREVKKREGK